VTAAGVVSTIPLGLHRGRDAFDLTVAQFEEAVALVENKLCSGDKYSAAGKHKRWLREAARLLSRRKFPTGSYSTTDEANLALRDAAEVGYLISPSAQVAKVLEGTAIVVTAFRADVQLDTFQDDEDRARRVPAKPMLDRIANALGVGWDARLCKRTDDSSSPYVRSCQAGGRLREFDGSWRDIQAQGEIDLRDGSALSKAIIQRFEGNRGRVELARRRQYVLAHSDTIARLRAIKRLGLRDSYLPSELAKPFFVARVQFTGESDSPETKAVFAERIADTFLPASNALFGKAAGQR
jgi:hypothetical protein